MRLWTRIWAWALVALAIILPGTALAQAEITTDPYGASGFAGLEVRCYGDRYVVGVVGRSGEIVDRLQLQCAKIGSNGNALQTDMVSVSVGGNGGAPVTFMCSGNTFARSIRVTLNQAKKQVRELSASCKDAAGNGGGGFTIGGPREGLSWIPGENYIWYRDSTCPANMAVVGLKVRYGEHINAIGAICAAIVRQPAPVATTPPGPARTGRVVDFGAPRNGEPRPPTPKMPSFVGRWTMTSREGGKAILVLNEADGNDLFGTLTSTDPRYNGAVTGTAAVSGRNFTFSYRDAATGKTGSGMMVYRGSDPKSILGTLKSDGPPPTSVVWGAQRQ